MFNSELKARIKELENKYVIDAVTGEEILRTKSVRRPMVYSWQTASNERVVFECPIKVWAYFHVNNYPKCDYVVKNEWMGDAVKFMRFMPDQEVTADGTPSVQQIDTCDMAAEVAVPTLKKRGRPAKKHK